MDDIYGHSLGYWFAHVVSAFAMLGSIAGFFPALAAVVALIWYSIQIWESRTVQQFRHRRHQRKIIRLTAELASLSLTTKAEAASLELREAAGDAAKSLTADAKKAEQDVKSALPSTPLITSTHLDEPQMI